MGTLVDNSQKSLKNMREENVDKDETLNNVNEIVEEDETNKDLKKEYPDKIIKLEEALLNYMGEKDLRTLKT